MQIEIHEEKNCAWCEVHGQFIYGKNAEEIRAALDKISKLSIYEY